VNNFKTFLLLSFVLQTGILFAQIAKEHTIHHSFAPFLREGDRPLLSFTLHNKQQTDWTGSASLTLLDSQGKQSVDGWFMNSVANQYFTVDTNSQQELLFPIEVPFLYNQSLSWKLAIESPQDSVVTTGTLPVLPWPYEDSINSPIATTSIIAIEKKVDANDAIQRGHKVWIEINFELQKNLESLIIVDEWAAGLVPEKGGIQVSGKINKYSLENKTARSRTIKFTNLSPGKYSIRYYALATYPGVFNQPPTLLFVDGSSLHSARSSYQKITIE
jgi:uncharacterized protein YfaS (alpha-2-macroglobulin family)